MVELKDALMVELAYCHHVDLTVSETAERIAALVNGFILLSAATKWMPLPAPPTETPLYTHPTDAKIKALVEALKTAALCLRQCADGDGTVDDMHTWADNAIRALAAFEGDV